MVLVAAVSFYTSRVILQVLGVNDYGVYNIVGSIVVFLSFFKNALTNATYRYLTFELGRGDSLQLKRLFAMSINVHVILAVSLTFILLIGGAWILNSKLNIPYDRMNAANWVFRFSLITFCIEVIKTPYNSIIIAHERMSFYALTSIVEVVIKLFVVFILQIVSIDKLILYAILLTFLALIIFVWYVLYCYRFFNETRYIFYWNSSMLKNLLSYSGWSVLVNAADVSVSQSISIFLNLFFGVVANAAMGIANQVNSLINTFLSSFTISFNPQIIKSYASGNKEYFMKLLYSTSKISFLLLFLVAFPIMLNINFLLEIWLINPPDMAGKFLICIACYSLFDSFSVPLWNAVHATGNLKVHQILMSSIKIMNIPLGYMLLYNGYPATSILVLYAFLNAVCAIVRIIYLRRLIGLETIKFMKEVLLRLLLVVIISCCFPLLIGLLDINHFMRFILTSFVFVIVYILAIYFVGLSDDERYLANELIKGKILRFKKFYSEKMI
ncbi:MAG: lipopolysaccharide biosynthesis protein [Bacteroidales bacterium]|nr:lipopolysaccharide biosynthesis protein [Bacteroidales bacterium]